jgi:phage terminase large subunit-like protein
MGERGIHNALPRREHQLRFCRPRNSKLFGELEIVAIGFDRWNWRHFKPCLERAGLSEDQLERFIEFGQGFQSMSPALRQLESALLDGRFGMTAIRR